MRANIFIVWGGNKELADTVSQKIKAKKEFNVQVGGDTPNQLFIGEQIISQIKKASVAILLVQKDSDIFRPNLMFEWGYIIANFKSKNVHVFLIDMEDRDLPSDLKGAWAQQISTKDKTVEETADEITETFIKNYHEQNIDKISVFEEWASIRHEIKNHSVNPSYTDREMAAIILYTLQAAYCYNDLHNLKNWLINIDSDDPIVDMVHTVVMGAIDYYISKEKPLSQNRVSELQEIIYRLEDDFDFSKEDSELDKWLHIIAHNFIGLCSNRISNIDDEDFNEYKKDFVEAALDNLLKALSYIGDDSEIYSCMWKGYIYRNVAICYAKMQDTENMTESFKKAETARKKVWKYFKSNINDAVIKNNFSLEYILIQLEIMKYTKQFNIIKLKTIEQQMKEFYREFQQQNMLYLIVDELLASVREMQKNGGNLQ